MTDEITQIKQEVDFNVDDDCLCIVHKITDVEGISLLKQECGRLRALCNAMIPMLKGKGDVHEEADHFGIEDDTLNITDAERKALLKQECGRLRGRCGELLFDVYGVTI